MSSVVHLELSKMNPEERGLSLKTFELLFFFQLCPQRVNKSYEWLRQAKVYRESCTGILTEQFICVIYRLKVICQSSSPTMAHAGSNFDSNFRILIAMELGYIPVDFLLSDVTEQTYPCRIGMKRSHIILGLQLLARPAM